MDRPYRSGQFRHENFDFIRVLRDPETNCTSNTRSARVHYVHVDQARCPSFRGPPPGPRRVRRPGTWCTWFRDPLPGSDPGPLGLDFKRVRTLERTESVFLVSSPRLSWCPHPVTYRTLLVTCVYSFL